MTEPLEDLLAEACDLAEQAGSLTLGWFGQSGLKVESKTDGSEVTDADRAAERFIREQLDVRHPDHAVRGEEEGGVVDTDKLTWIIDPIDGTRGFARGVPLFSTLLAVADSSGPIIGVIHIPVLQSTIAAGRGIGCWRDGKRTYVSKTSALQEALVNTSAYDTFADSWLVGLKHSGAMMRTWGDAFGYYLVAAGQADAMIDPVCSPWDLAPMPVILGEAGGQFTDLAGKSSFDLNATPDSISGIASNGLIHDDLLEILAKT